MASLNRSSIDEANRHLHAMHERVQYLEGVIQEQNQALMDKDTVLHQQIADVERSKNKEIHVLQSKIQDLKETMCRKDTTIDKLQSNLEAFQNILHYLPELQNLVSAMKNAQLMFNSANSNEKGDCNGLHIDGQGDILRENSVHVTSLAKHYVTNHRSRNFSISEGDSDTEMDNNSPTATKNSSIKEEPRRKDSQDKEYYL